MHSVMKQSTKWPDAVNRTQKHCSVLTFPETPGGVPCAWLTQVCASPLQLHCLGKAAAHDELLHERCYDIVRQMHEVVFACFDLMPLSTSSIFPRPQLSHVRKRKH